jgi:hypothetical protein
VNWVRLVVGHRQTKEAIMAGKPQTSPRSAALTDRI